VDTNGRGLVQTSTKRVTAATLALDICVMSASGKHVHTLLDGPSNDYPSEWARRR
jgi:hypothetical protein